MTIGVLKLLFVTLLFTNLNSKHVSINDEELQKVDLS
jgi:hypothetical protein